MIKNPTDKHEQYDEYSELYYDSWEMLDDPQELTSAEILVARRVLDLMRIDIEVDYIINYRTTPRDIANLIVNIKRLIELKTP